MSVFNIRVCVKCIFMAMFIVSISSCKHNFYAPNTVNVPVLKKVNDISISANYSSVEYAEGGEIHSAYAIDSSTTVLFNAMYLSHELYNLDNAGVGDTGDGSFFELGYGIYNFNTGNDDLILNLFGYIGILSANNYFKDNSSPYFDDPNISNTFLKYSIQGNLGYSFWYIDIIASLRLANLQLISVVHSPYMIGDRLGEYVDSLKDNPTTISTEYGLILRVGGDKFKVQAQLCGTNEKPFYSNTMIFSTGIIYSF